MNKKTFSIKKNCRLLVEQILNEDFLNANSLLQKLINEEQERRERNILKSLISEQDEDSEGDFEGDDELDGGEEDIDDEGDEADEPSDGSPDLGETLDDEDADEAEQVGEGKLNEMTTELTNLNHSLNKAKIKKLYNKISTLKSQLNALNLDKDEMEYIELETKLSFYSEVLENLQQQSMPGIDGTEQDEMKEKINVVYKALKDLETEIAAGGQEDDIETDDEEVEDDAESDESEDEDVEDEAEDEGEEETEDEGEEDEDESDEIEDEE